MRFRTPALLLGIALAIGGCTDDFDGAELEGRIDYEGDRPGELAEPTVPVYTGAEEAVVEAQTRFKTGLDLHQKIIYRTCTPFDGVCHNQKEYPELRTPGAFVAAIAAPCNVQSGEWESVYDRCEQRGDRFALGGGGEVEIGWIEFVAGDGGEYPDLDGDSITPESPGLHLHLSSPVDFGDRNNRYETGRFVRTFINDRNEVEEISFASFRTQWFSVGDGTHLIAEVRNYQVDQIEDLLSVGIVQGDLNRNGTLGARDTEQVPLINPGNPEESYLIARLRGVMLGQDVPGSRMPLANQPLNIAEMLALFCWVEGLDDNAGVDLKWDINYADCSYAEDPENLNLLGKGVTWEQRVSKILEFNCGGCHTQNDPQGGLNLVGDDVYLRLLEPSGQVPDMKLIEPGDPSRSYLFLKLQGDPSILGLKMPFNPLTGEGELNAAELGDIETWIVNGAVENE